MRTELHTRDFSVRVIAGIVLISLLAGGAAANHIVVEKFDKNNVALDDGTVTSENLDISNYYFVYDGRTVTKVVVIANNTASKDLTVDIEVALLHGENPPVRTTKQDVVLNASTSRIEEPIDVSDTNITHVETVQITAREK